MRRASSALRTFAPSARPGFGLIELIVAMMLLAVGVLGLAAAAVLAQRSFREAEATERAARAAAQVLDSLMHEPAPADGARTMPGILTSWTVTTDTGGVRIHLNVQVDHVGVRRTFDFRASHALLPSAS